MDEALFTLSMPDNEPILDYAPGSRERKSLKQELDELKSKEIEIPLIVGGKEIRTGDLGRCVMPHEHGHTLAVYHKAGPKEIELAVDAAKAAWKSWSYMPWSERVSVFLKAAELLSGPWRDKLNAATILSQSKTVQQAEIDAACEMIDFFRFNGHFADRIYSEQPASALGIWDRLEWRPLEGFIFSVSPFNFTSIAGNLAGAPAVMGNTVIWKPASSAVYSGYYVMKLLEDAGIPGGVINFLPGSGHQLGGRILKSPDLAGVHFTGSTKTFQEIWSAVGRNISHYRSYPRLVGETGGKDFIMAHHSADADALITALVIGAFEYQGQKCSAASRAYIPDKLWPRVKAGLMDMIPKIKVGDPSDFTNFMGAVIDERAFDKIDSYIEFARVSSEAEIITGGTNDKIRGYFVSPTVVHTNKPHFKLMEEEIFGPVLTLYVYPEEKYDEILKVCDSTSPYALTGSIFARDRNAIHQAHRDLRHAAGNFYVNDKPTGAVVGMQPFGGSRLSGTNDKAGSMLNLLRWVTPRTIKENFVPPVNYEYPHMKEEDTAQEN